MLGVQPQVNGLSGTQPNELSRPVNLLFETTNIDHWSNIGGFDLIKTGAYMYKLFFFIFVSNQKWRMIFQIR